MFLIFNYVISSFIWVFGGFLLVLVFGIKVVKVGSCSVMDFDFGANLSSLVNVSMVLDVTSLMFSCSVLFISSWILLYSGYYMSHEKFISRFLGLMVLFIMSMNFLVLFPSLLFMMVGWDGLGVTSFLLVVYYMNYGSLSAGMITALSNRLGDAVFILVVGMCGFFFGYDYYSLINFSIPVFILFMLVIGSITKSAQVPFSAWLPAAMAAPTPVSSLVHSSTLVTAGVYVLIRFNVILSVIVLYFLVMVSVITVAMAGCSALGEVDMKKVVALSTLSQVGVMMLSLGLGLPDVALFHLLAHAFFKALMFMCVGSVIFSSGGIQDGRFLGGLWLKSPVVFCWLVVCTLSLMGVPFMSGFYSKDLIMESWASGFLSFTSIILLYISIFLTSFYGIRMVILLSRSDETMSFRCCGENNLFLLTPLFGMGFGALWGGYVFQSIVLCFNDFIYVSSFEKLFVLFSVTAGVIFPLMMSFIYFDFMSNIWGSVKVVKGFLVNMWFLPPLSGNYCSSVFLNLAGMIINYLEKGWISYIVYSVYFGLSEGSKVARASQFNSVGLMMVVSLFFCFFIFWL